MTKATKSIVKLTADEKRALAAIIGTCDTLDGDLFTRPADAVLAIIDALGCSGQAAGGYITSLGNKGILDTEEDSYGLGFWVNVDIIGEDDWREVEDGAIQVEFGEGDTAPVVPGDFIEWNGTEIPVNDGELTAEMVKDGYAVVDTISCCGQVYIVCTDGMTGYHFALAEM